MSQGENKIDPEFRERLNKYCDKLLEIINTSNEQFEKQLVYISGGGLALSFIVIEKVLKEFFTTQYKIVLIIGWVALAATLLLNLFSHKKAIDTHSATLKHIKDVLRDSKIKYDSDSIDKRNQRISKLNTTSLCLLSLGLTCLIFYTSINLLCLKK